MLFLSRLFLINPIFWYIVHQPTAGVAFDFIIPYMYKGMGIAGKPPFVECADSLNTTSCPDLRICVLDGTTYVERVTELLPGVAVSVEPTTVAFYNSFRAGLCDVLAGDQFEIAEETVRQKGYFGEYEVGQNLYSKEPLALVTTEDDPTWSDFVNWVVQGLLAAEEQGFTQGTTATFTQDTAFGEEFGSMFDNALRAVGNYEEMVRATDAAEWVRGEGTEPLLFVVLQPLFFLTLTV